MSKKVEFTINLNGNAISGVATLAEKVEGLSNAAERAKGLFAKIGDIGLRMHGIMSTVEQVTGKLREFTEASKAQQEAEAKLAQVMRNTMGASNGEIESIKELASAQQKLGVIGDEVQLAGAQELGTYLSKADSLKRLMPVMNDMLAQQYGLNASQEQAVQIASMMGKVMDGQVGALSRYGYKFDEAQEKLLKYGSEEERVATLAEVISQSVGGMNEALAATPEGKIQQVANSIGDIKERIGALWMQIQARLLPVAERLMAMANGLIDIVQKGWPVWIGAAAGVLVAVTKIQHKLQATSLAALLSGGSFTTMGSLAKAACKGIGTAIKSIPIVGWVTGAITLLGGLFTWLWNRFDGFRAFVEKAVEGLLNGLIKALNGIIKLWGKVTGKEVTLLKKVDFDWVTKKAPTLTAPRMGSMGNGADLALGEGAMKRASGGAEAAVTGGTRNTTVNINLGKMVENIVFNGGLGENAQELEIKIQEILTRTLMMAAATA